MYPLSGWQKAVFSLTSSRRICSFINPEPKTYLNPAWHTPIGQPNQHLSKKPLNIRNWTYCLGVGDNGRSRRSQHSFSPNLCLCFMVRWLWSIAFCKMAAASGTGTLVLLLDCVSISSENQSTLDVWSSQESNSMLMITVAMPTVCCASSPGFVSLESPGELWKILMLGYMPDQLL